ncbi:MAG TPA: histidine kinase dimerization/phosphoacceptor domain -containing protein [Verrucomicrobiae bacterium]
MRLLASNSEVRAERQARGPVAPYRRFGWLLAGGWTVAVAGSFAWNLAHNAQELKYITFQTAQALLEKDLLYREWSILHGGVYIPRPSDAGVTALAQEKEREIITASGQRLTLLNPSVVSREIFALQDEEMGVRGHITSLTPVQPANQPDAWERQGLEAFENGAKEVSGTENRNGKRLFRMMRPLVTVPSCLHCHEEAGRKLGTIRGGISVTVPMERFAAEGKTLHLSVAHGGLWMIGLTGLVFGVRNLERHNLGRKLAENRTRAALKEKEALLQEIHHRVKNNLQVISSLFQLQINELKDSQTIDIFRESQLRIRSMALIHEKLYQADSFARIDLADYLRSLTSLLFSTYASARGRVALHLDIAPICVTLDSAIPLGLIANELITNGLKFAFPSGRQGIIRVELAVAGDAAVRFRVADNGVGFPPGFDLEKSASLGMRLVKILTRQLEARGTWDEVASGTSFTLEFQEPIGGNGDQREEGSRRGEAGPHPKG